MKRIVAWILCVVLCISYIPCTVSAAGTYVCAVQWEAKWKNYKYGEGNLYDTGCGIFALVNAVGYLTGKSMDIPSVASWAYSIKAFNVAGSDLGTLRHVLYPNAATKYGKTYGFEIDYGSNNSGYSESSGSSRLKQHC